MKLIHSGVVGDELALAFDNGKECFLPLVVLRRSCPCAACGEKPPRLLTAGSPATTLQEIRVVGAYALLLSWQDGHSSGIYSFERLAGMDPMRTDDAK
jgi:DUF971 family protein